tara:strand:+ start:497 stop:1015 length:519 start_codon:yes stop_codon:yes gene_type:complete
MIKNKDFIITLFFSLFLITPIFAKNILYIDLNKIVLESKPGSLLIEKFKKLNDDNIEKFRKIEKELKDEENKLLLQKNILSEKDFNTKVNNLRLKIKTYNKNKQKTFNDLNEIKLNSTENLLNSINPILNKYSKDNNISLILQKKFLVIGKSELDITDKIMKIVNEEIKINK